MARDNVATLRRYHELLNERGEIAVELLHPDVQVHMFEGSRERPDTLEAAGLDHAA
ncbi:MAG TPA: hypothetical protein VF072_14950 [Thermoleophilaceae bacterium]